MAVLVPMLDAWEADGGRVGRNVGDSWSEETFGVSGRGFEGGNGSDRGHSGRLMGAGGRGCPLNEVIPAVEPGLHVVSAGFHGGGPVAGGSGLDEKGRGGNLMRPPAPSGSKE